MVELLLSLLPQPNTLTLDEFKAKLNTIRDIIADRANQEEEEAPPVKIVPPLTDDE